MTLDNEKIERSLDPLKWARAELVKLDPKVKEDIRTVYSGEFLEPSAILFDLEPTEFRGLADKLKGRGINKADFERKTRERLRELQEAEKARKQSAKAAGVNARAPGMAGAELKLRNPEPWDQPVDGARLLDALVALLKRYLILPQMAANAIALWIMHTFVIDAAEVTPRLVIESPKKRCGKTRLLALLLRLCLRALPSSNISAASVFRTIEAMSPTLIVDEADTFLSPKLRNGGNDEL